MVMVDRPRCSMLVNDGTHRYMRWLVILGSWVNWFIWTGAMKCLATLLPTLRDQMETYTWVIGLIIQIMAVSLHLVGPVAAPLRRQFGVRICVMVGGLMIGLAFIIASFSSALVIAVVLALLAGPGLGITNVLCRELVGQHFSVGRLSTAFAISQSGNSFSFVIVPPLTQLFLDTYGWRAAMLLLGAIFLHMAVCGALFSPSDSDWVMPSDYSVVPDHVSKEPHSSEDNRENRKTARKKSGFSAFWHNLNTDLLCNWSYWCIAVIGMVAFTGTAMWEVYFVPHSQAKGLTPHESVTLTSIMGLSRIVAAFTLGPLMDKIKIVGSKGFMGIALTSLTVYYLVDPWLTSFWLNAVNVALYGCSTFLMLLLMDVVLVEVVSLDYLASAFGWIGMKIGVLSLLLFLPGLAFDLGGSYTLPFMLLGGFHILSIASLLLLVFIQSRK